MDRQVKTIAHLNRGTGTVAPFDSIYTKSVVARKGDDLDGVDALVIWGGEDISPTLYNEKPTKHCYADEELSQRDVLEAEACRSAIERGIPIIGVCRGAQLLCALAGGKLVQDVSNHGSSHAIKTDDGRSIITSSVHHQMMYPFGMKPEDYKIIAWSEEARSKHYEGVEEAPPVEPEIVFFPKIKGLAIQGHPEFMSRGSEFVVYVNDLVKEYLK